MIDITDDKVVWDEIRASREATKVFVETLEDMVREYHGPGFRADETQGFAPENITFEAAAVLLPQIVWNNPRVKVSTRLQGQQQQVADALQQATNRWIKDNRLGEWLLNYPALDAFFKFGVVLVRNEERTGHPTVQMFGEDGKPTEGVPWSPQVYRISPRLYFEDPMAEDRESVRIQGHTWFMDHDDLIKLAEDDPDGGWDLEAIRGLKPNEGVSPLRDNRVGQAPKRNEITIHTSWVAEAQPDDDKGPEEGFNGAILTFADGTSTSDVSGGGAGVGTRIRDNMPYYGPSSGPYVVFGYFHVPDSAMPLGLIAAMEAQIAEMQAHAKAVLMSDREYKRGHIVDTTESQLKRKLEAMEHNTILAISGFDPSRMADLNVGGSTPEMRENFLWAAERVNKGLGLDDAQRGNVSGAKLATEVAVADTATKTRVSLLQRRFRAPTEGVLGIVMWYLYHDHNVVFALGEPEGPQEWAMPDGSPLETPWFYGGEYEPDEPGSYESLELEVDIYSMPRMSEQTAMMQVQMGDAFVTNVVPLLPQLPHFRPDRYLRWRQDMLNSADMASWLDLDMLAQMTGQEGGDTQATPTLVKRGKIPELMKGNPSSTPAPAVGLQQASPAGPGAAGGAASTVTRQGVA